MDHGGKNIPVLIKELATTFAEDDKEFVCILQSCALQFLSANTENLLKSVISEASIVEDIRIQLAKKNEKYSVEFYQLYEKLKDFKKLSYRREILRFLSLVSQYYVKRSDVKLLDVPSQCSVSVPIEKSIVNSSEGIDQLCNKSSTCTSTSISLKSLVKTNGKYVSVKTVSSSHSYLSYVSARSSGGDLKIPNRDLVKELLFAFQGVGGKLLKKEPGTGGFIIDSRSGVDKLQCGMILRLSELGFLHNQVKSYCDNIDNRFGRIGQCFVSVLQTELSDYYKMIAELQSSLRGDSPEEEITLRRIMVWSVRPISRMTLLADLTKECENKKGGELICSVFLFAGHGSPDFKMTSRRILKAICTPLLRVLTRWLLYGLLEDPCSEFFIESRPVSKNEQLWYDKYHLRQNMIPGFISPSQAKQILVTGKSINFLRDVCNDATNIVAKDSIQRTFENMNVEALFVPELNLEFRKTLELAYWNTSQRVLYVMREEYKLCQHIQAFKKFLLLGQGDFIQVLMELLAPELSKPAKEVYTHTLSGILDNSVRSSNAQYEEEDILNRLDIRLMEFTTGDFGWDVFSMLYHVEGPIGTIFHPVLESYRTLFSALWKAKRVEYVLSRMWKRQITSTKSFRQLKDVHNVMHIVHVLTSEMVHFMQQTQYYFLFEVVECTWVKMLSKLNTAETLDDIITAHKTFLDRVYYGVLFDHNSQELYTQLYTIYNVILKLETLDEGLHQRVLTEIEQIKRYKKKSHLSGGFVKAVVEHKEYVDQRQNFHNFLQSAKTQIRSVEKQYKDNVQKYLQMLASNSDDTLKLLRVRLDFNGYYERLHAQM